MNKTLLMCCATLLAGCVGHYQQPSEIAPHATLDARWGDNDLMSGGFQGYWIYNDAHCQKSANSGVLGEISQSDPAKNRFLIEPDKRVFLNALSSGIKQREPGERLTSKSCINIVSFIPDAGVTYQITHSAPKSGCTLKLVDLKTGKAPASLIIEPVTKECGF
jgi:hypothetical protein